MEEKIDMILEKISKIDSIENHFTLLQQDIGKMRSKVKEMDMRLTDIENAVSFMETTYQSSNNWSQIRWTKTVSSDRQYK